MQGWIDAIKEVFLRFGSTRWLNTACGLTLLYGESKIDPSMTWACILCGTLLTGITLASFHYRPHGGSGGES